MKRRESANALSTTPDRTECASSGGEQKKARLAPRCSCASKSPRFYSSSEHPRRSRCWRFSIIDGLGEEKKISTWLEASPSLRRETATEGKKDTAAKGEYDERRGDSIDPSIEGRKQLISEHERLTSLRSPKGRLDAHGAHPSRPKDLSSCCRAGSSGSSN